MTVLNDWKSSAGGKWIERYICECSQWMYGKCNLSQGIVILYTSYIYSFSRESPQNHVGAKEHLTLVALLKGWNSRFHDNRRAKTPLIRWNVWGGTQAHRDLPFRLFFRGNALLYMCFLSYGLGHRIWRFQLSCIKYVKHFSLILYVSQNMHSPIRETLKEFIDLFPLLFA